MRNGEFLKYDPKKDEKNNYLISGLIPKNQIVLVAGLPGGGKSFFLHGIAYSMAYGAPFLGRTTVKAPVLIIDGEHPDDVLKKRLRMITKGLKNKGYNHHDEIDIQNDRFFRLDERSTWTEIETVINDIKPILITIDHLMAFHDRDENDAKSMEKIVQALLYLKSLSDASILVCHHLGKLKSGSLFYRLRGSSVIYARSETAFEIRSLKTKDGGLESFGVIPQARKGKIVPPFRVTLDENKESLVFRNDGEYNPIDDPEVDRLSHMVCHAFIKDKTEKTVNKVKEILAGMGSDSEVREALRTMSKMELIRARQDGKSHKFVYCPKPQLTCPWCNYKAKP
jgi:hypothetical protein